VRVTIAGLLLAGVLWGTAACGRKGPPLPPIVRLPAPATDLTARRLGDTVVLQFTVPTTNTDASRTGDLDRMEVYAHTGPLPVPTDFLKFGTLVGSVAVKPSIGAASAAAVPGVAPGSKAIVAEPITAAQLELGKVPPVRNASARARPAVEPEYETPETVNVPLPVNRYYVVVGVTRSNHRGAFSPPVALPLVQPFVAPGELKASYDQDAISLTWTPPERGADIFVPEPTYNVYQQMDEPPAGGTPEGAGASAATPPVTAEVLTSVNPVPVTTPAFKDTRMEFGAVRCYVVRSVRMSGLKSIESEPSPAVCLTPVDTFPPAAPRQLTSVVNENGVSLIWEPNTEKDLVGYLVLRGETPGEKLTPLMTTPIRETTYVDSTVHTGASYDYVVVAVDNAPTPNISDYSNRVTEVIR
jgi:predicted small lipoprotein YifL